MRLRSLGQVAQNKTSVKRKEGRKCVEKIDGYKSWNSLKSKMIGKGIKTTYTPESNKHLLKINICDKYLKKDKVMKINKTKKKKMKWPILENHFMNAFTTPTINQMWHKVNFYAEFYGFWIQSFPSPRPVVILRLKSQVCSTIYP